MQAVKKYPGYYADEQGNIYSMRSGAIRLLSQRMHKGYYCVNIFQRQRPKIPLSVCVHTLVLIAYIGERPDGMVCRHLNGNPLDNRILNLRWGTPSENAQDAIRHGTAVCLRYGERAIAAKLKLHQILKIRELYSQGYTQKVIADCFGVTKRHVSDIVRGNTWKQALRGEQNLPVEHF